MKAPGNGQYVYGPRGAGLREGFVDPYEDIIRLADTVAEATATQLFEHAGRLVLLREGKLVNITLHMLGEIITENVVTPRLVNRGTQTEPSWELAYTPYVPNPGEVRRLFTADTLKSGSLQARVLRV
jgi:hypothetical protein